LQILNKLKGKPMATFLEDDNGNHSSMRLMSVIALVAAVLLAFIAVLQESAMALDLVKLFLVAAFAPKAIQKFAEK
jgi:hypothetical protein